MLDEKDEYILAELKKNSRNSTKNIASNVKIPRITVHSRIQKMIDNKIIKSFTVIPDYKKIGLTSTVISKIVLSFYQKQVFKRVAVNRNFFQDKFKFG